MFVSHEVGREEDVHSLEDVFGFHEAASEGDHVCVVVHSKEACDFVVIADAAADAFDFVRGDADAFGTATAEDAVFRFSGDDVFRSFLSEDWVINRVG